MHSSDPSVPDLLLRELVEDHRNSFWDVLRYSCRACTCGTGLNGFCKITVEKKVHDFARSVPDKNCGEELSTC